MIPFILYTIEDGERVRAAATEEFSVVQAAAADWQDETDLKAIETKIKHRPKK